MFWQLLWQEFVQKNFCKGTYFMRETLDLNLFSYFCTENYAKLGCTSEEKQTSFVSSSLGLH